MANLPPTVSPKVHNAFDGFGRYAGKFRMRFEQGPSLQSHAFSHQCRVTPRMAAAPNVSVWNGRRLN
jgi:hypothetical protein